MNDVKYDTVAKIYSGWPNNSRNSNVDCKFGTQPITALFTKPPVGVLSSWNHPQGLFQPPAPFTAYGSFRNCTRQNHGTAGNREAGGFVNSAVSIDVIVKYNSTNKYICLCHIQLNRHAKSDMMPIATWFTASSSKKYKLGLQLNNATSSWDSLASIKLNIFHLHYWLHSKKRHFCFQATQFQVTWLGSFSFGHQVI